MARRVAIDYLDPTVYHDAISNPTNEEPSTTLMTVFKKHRAPLAIIKTLVAGGFKERSDFASAAPDETTFKDRMAALVALNALWNANPIIKYREEVSLIAVWNECRVRHEVAQKKRADSEFDADYKPVQVAGPLKDATILKFRSSPYGAFFKLHPWLIPHDTLWDDADTRFTNTGRWPFYTLNECRARTETIKKTSKFGNDDEGRLKSGAEIHFHVWIDTKQDAKRRQKIHWILCAFEDVLPFEKGIQYIQTFETWSVRMNPSLEAWLWADKHWRNDMVSLCRDEADKYKSYEQTFDKLLPLLETKYFLEAIHIHGVEAEVPLTRESRTETIQPNAKASAVADHLGRHIEGEESFQADNEWFEDDTSATTSKRKKLSGV